MFSQMIYVLPGTLQSGSQSPLTLTNGFWLGKYQVTQEEWEQVMGNNPSHFKGKRNPVETISWDDVVAFCQKLTKQEPNLPPGYVYRLTTETEWEFAARGGLLSKGYEYSGSNDIDEVAWYYGNSDNTTHEVGLKKPNELGFHDMSGNVWEWCLEVYEGEFRVNRGGGWFNFARDCRAADRSGDTPGNRYDFLGCRLALGIQIQ